MDWAHCSIGLVSKDMHNFREHGQVTNTFTKCTGMRLIKQGKAVLDQMICHVTPKKRHRAQPHS
jgi:hypothetical protein